MKEIRQLSHKKGRVEIDGDLRLHLRNIIEPYNQTMSSGITRIVSLQTTHTSSSRHINRLKFTTCK